MSRGLRLLLLSCACSLAPAAREVKVACSEAVDLPCAVRREPRGPYDVSWAKLTEGGEEKIEELRDGLHSQKEGSLAAPEERLHLKIRNTTTSDSGTYRCTVEELDGQRNQSGTVTLKVTGCPKERKETFQKYRAEIVLLLALVVFYLTLIIFTCFAQQQSIFPDFSKPRMERAFLPVTSPHKHLESVTFHKTEVV